jgi:hypothetical protein
MLGMSNTKDIPTTKSNRPRFLLTDDLVCLDKMYKLLSNTDVYTRLSLGRAKLIKHFFRRERLLYRYSTPLDQFEHKSGRIQWTITPNQHHWFFGVGKTKTD